MVVMLPINGLYRDSVSSALPEMEGGGGGRKGLLPPANADE
jgi:hypothetical protein